MSKLKVFKSKKILFIVLIASVWLAIIAIWSAGNKISKAIKETNQEKIENKEDN